MAVWLVRTTATDPNTVPHDTGENLNQSEQTDTLIGITAIPTNGKSPSTNSIYV